MLLFFYVLILDLAFFLGPKPKTIEDFWTMITQEDVSTIVCLTNLKEGAKVSILKLSNIN